jgi:hypothetical protein
MKRRVVATLGVVLLAALRATAAAAAERSFSSAVTIEPWSRPGAYRALAEVKDASTQELLAAPQTVFSAGDVAETKTTLASGEVVLFSVEADVDGANVFCSIAIRRGETVVSEQKVRIVLAKRG